MSDGDSGDWCEDPAVSARVAAIVRDLGAAERAHGVIPDATLEHHATKLVPILRDWPSLSATMKRSTSEAARSLIERAEQVAPAVERRALEAQRGRRLERDLWSLATAERSRRHGTAIRVAIWVPVSVVALWTIWRVSVSEGLGWAWAGFCLMQVAHALRDGEAWVAYDHASSELDRESQPLKFWAAVGLWTAMALAVTSPTWARVGAAVAAALQ